MINVQQFCDPELLSELFGEHNVYFLSSQRQQGQLDVRKQSIIKPFFRLTAWLFKSTPRESI